MQKTSRIWQNINLNQKLTDKQMSAWDYEAGTTVFF